MVKKFVLFSLLLLFSVSLVLAVPTETQIKDTGNSTFSSGIDATGSSIYSDNFYGTTFWALISGKATHLGNFTDNLGNRGYTSLSNFTDDLGSRGYTHLSNFTNNIPNLAFTNQSNQFTGIQNFSKTTTDSFPAINVVSTNNNMSAGWITGNETSTGTLKISHTYPNQDDSNSSALSLDMTGAGTNAQGLFIDGDETNGSLIHLKDTTSSILKFFYYRHFFYRPVTITNTNETALLIEKTDGTDIFRVDTSSDYVYTGSVRPRSDNASDIGLSATSYRHGYFDGVVTAGSFAGDGSQLTNLPYTNGTGLSLSGTTFSIVTCSDTQILKYNSTSVLWECESDNGGTDTDTWNTTEEMQDAVGVMANGSLRYDDTNAKFYVNLTWVQDVVTSYGYITDANTSGLIRDWNTTGYIKDWNSTGLIKNWDATAETDPYAYNGTLAYNSSLSNYYPNSNPYSFVNTTTATNLNNRITLDALNITTPTGLNNKITLDALNITTPTGLNNKLTINCANLTGGSDGNYCVDADTTYSVGTNLSLSGTTISANMTSLKSWFDLFYQTIGSYLSNLVEDTTPQLGGNLDVNGKNITLGNNKLLNQTGGASIYHNGTGWVIIG